VNQLDITINEKNEEISQVIADAIRIRTLVADKVKGSRKFVSLGQNCSTAWYLKQLGLKVESYPFDWVFSSPKIIEHCISDNFATYLNRAHITNLGKSAGHDLYHSSFFNHRSPLKSEGDFQYYQRCCERFENMLDSKYAVTFVVTLINEPLKRSVWANGFDRNYTMPSEQDYESCLGMIKAIEGRHPNSKFIIIDHYTEGARKIRWKDLSENCGMITFTAKGTSNGVFYTNPFDNFLYNLLFTSFVSD
jgi:hypothetical protein